MTSEAAWRPQWSLRSKNWIKWVTCPYEYMDMRVIDVTDFKSEVRFVLRGHLEAVMTSKI